MLPAILGFALRLNDFLAHALAGVSGLILGAVLAVWLIERLLHERRREQWDLVYLELRKNMCECVVKMAAAFALALPSGSSLINLPGPDEIDPPDLDFAEALDHFTLLVGSEIESSSAAASKDPVIASSGTLLRQVTPVVAPMQNATTTRVIAMGDDPKLVSLLLAFERAQRQWASWVGEVELSRSPDRVAWQQAVATLRAGVAVYRFFATAAAHAKREVSANAGV